MLCQNPFYSQLPYFHVCHHADRLSCERLLHLYAGPRHSCHSLCQSGHQGCASADRLGGRASRQVPRRALARPQLHHPVRRSGRIPPLPQGNPARYAESGLHYARQHSAHGRRRALLSGDGSPARELRHLQLHHRHHAACADDASQRDRQDGARQDF